MEVNPPPDLQALVGEYGGYNKPNMAARPMACRI
jgi:hypothetical protein